MERFMAAVRRLFGKKENDGDSQEHNDHNKREPNEVQKVQRQPHPYDDVKMDEEGATVGEHDANEFQKAPDRAPRSYEEVDLPVNAGGKIEIR